MEKALHELNKFMGEYKAKFYQEPVEGKHGWPSWNEKEFYHGLEKARQIFIENI